MVDKERVESGEKIDPKEVFRQMINLLDSEGRVVFTQFPHEERSPLSKRLEQLGTDLRRLDRELTLKERRKERERLGVNFTVRDLMHPEEVIERRCRVGKHIDLSRITPKIEQFMTPRMRHYRDFCRSNIKDFGHDALAQLCLAESLQNWLIHGVAVRKGNIVDLTSPVRVRTISEFRDLLARHEEIYSPLARNPHPLHSYKQGRQKLAVWDAIPEEPQNPPIST